MHDGVIMADRPIRTALVLGAGSDIGVATVEALAAVGLRRCVLAARTPSIARDRIGHLDLEFVELEWDALDVATHATTFADVWSAHGPIDVVLCAVGMLGHHAGVTMSPDEVDLMARTNYAGPAAALATIVPHLVEQATGTIVVYSSVAAVRPRRSNFVYGSSKAGLDAFAHGLADALVGTGVAVVVVRPGFRSLEDDHGSPAGAIPPRTRRRCGGDRHRRSFGSIAHRLGAADPRWHVRRAP